VHQRRKAGRESSSAACACTAEAANPCRQISVGVTPIESLPSHLDLCKASSDQRRAIRSGQEAAASKSIGSAIRSRSLRLTIDSAITVLHQLNPWTSMNGPLDCKRDRARGRDPRFPVRKSLITSGRKRVDARGQASHLKNSFLEKSYPFSFGSERFPSTELGCGAN
jgi:hypothetical protein